LSTLTSFKETSYISYINTVIPNPVASQISEKGLKSTFLFQICNKTEKVKHCCCLPKFLLVHYVRRACVNYRHSKRRMWV